MARVKGDPLPEVPIEQQVPPEEQDTGQGTVGPDTSDKTGMHLTAARKNYVDDYPERPYRDAITDSHREVLREAGVEPE